MLLRTNKRKTVGWHSNRWEHPFPSTFQLHYSTLTQWECRTCEIILWHLLHQQFQQKQTSDDDNDARQPKKKQLNTYNKTNQMRNYIKTYCKMNNFLVTTRWVKLPSFQTCKRNKTAPKASAFALCRIFTVSSALLGDESTQNHTQPKFHGLPALFYQ